MFMLYDNFPFGQSRVPSWTLPTVAVAMKREQDRKSVLIVMELPTLAQSGGRPFLGIPAIAAPSPTE